MVLFTQNVKKQNNVVKVLQWRVSSPLINHVTSGVSRNSDNFGTKTNKATTKVILSQPLTKVPFTKTEVDGTCK